MILSASEFGTVFLCQFPFTSGSEGKIRPALVLFDLRNDAIICRITSVVRTDKLDVILLDWNAAGLLKPSVARLDRIVTVEKSVFLRRLGKLSAADANSVRTTWNRHLTFV
jgi:mRNA interferase MazF